MFWKVTSTTLTIGAIALNTTFLEAKESHSQAPAQSNTIFVCATTTQPPTLFAYTPGKINLTPLMGWHREYLLPNQSGTEICQQVAVKLQTQFQQKQPRFFITEKQEDRNVLCLVTQENANCSSENSEELFSVNSNYDPTCVLDNHKPLECLAISRSRGVLGLPESPYTPTWQFWPW